MNILMLFPPQWMPTSPHFAIPTLLGQFKDLPYNVDVMDLNIDFYDEILTKSYLKKAIELAQKSQEKTINEISKVYSPEKNFYEYSFDMQNKIAKYGMIKNYLAQNQNMISQIPNLVEDAVKAIKSKELFYNPDNILKAMNIIDSALDLASLPYYPSKISFSSYTNQFFKLNYETIKFYVFDKNTNMFFDYYDKILPKIKEKNPDYIGISINSSSQIVAGLTLSNLLKNHTNAHINIGGNFFGRVIDNLQKYKEFFELFADSILIEEGEVPVIELAKYINKEIPIEKVSNLVYLQEGEIKINPKANPVKLNEMNNITLEGFELEKYLTPYVVMPFQTSKGCYWRKCSFCDHDFGQHYNIKNIEKLIEQIKEIKEKYNITKFEFIDEAISPNYMLEFSKRLIEEKLDITFFCNARLESEFSKEILEIAHKAGLRMVLWGVESGSKRIMELINKGVDIDNRLNILRNSREAGICNFAFIFFGFPAETKEEARQTIKMLCENTDIINSYGKCSFTMGKHTKLRENPEAYGVVGPTKQEEELSPTYEYNAIGMSKEELNSIMQECTTRCNEVYGKSLAMFLGYRELLYLYVDKYGTDWVCDYKFK